MKQSLLFLVALLTLARPANACQDAGLHLELHVTLPDCDSVLAVFHPVYVPGSEKHVIDTIIHVTGGKASFRTGTFDRFGYLAIYPYVKDMNKLHWHSRRMFLVAAGDRVQADISEHGMVFSGRGAAKYNAVFAMESGRQWGGGPVFNIAAGAADGRAYLVSLERRQDSVQLAAQLMLNTYRDAITEEEYAMLDADNVAQTLLNRLLAISRSLYASHTDTTLIRNLVWQFKRNFQPLNLDTASGHMKSFSQYHPLLLVEAAYLSLALQAGAGKNFNFVDVHADDVFAFLDNRLQGRLRCAALLTVACKYANSGTDPNNELLANAVDRIQDPGLLAIAKDKYLTESVGSPFRPFGLRDTSGVVHTLESIKGKVTLFDFWYTGCVHCSVLSGRLEPFLDSLSGRADFQVVSISIDKDPGIWTASVRSGKYTHAHALNLYTGGLGVNDDLLQYYDIRSFPRLMLMDAKGRLIDANIFANATSVMEAVKKALE